MPINVRCGGCNQVLSVPDELVGKEVKCSVCQMTLKIPDPNATSPTPPSPSSAEGDDIIRVKCGSCSKVIKAPKTMAGKKGQCPRCKMVFIVPGGSPPPPAPSSAPPADPFGLPAGDPLAAPQGDPLGNPYADPFASSPPSGPFVPPPQPSRLPVQPRQPVQRTTGAQRQVRRTSHSGGSNPLVIPAVFLYIFSGFTILGGLLRIGLSIFAMVIVANNPQVPDGVMVQLGSEMLGGFLLAAFNIAIVVGATSMVRRSSLRSARMGAIVAMIPCCSGCLVLTIPFGIWAFVMMQNPDVYRRFQQQ